MNLISMATPFPYHTKAIKLGGVVIVVLKLNHFWVSYCLPTCSIQFYPELMAFM